MPTELEKQVGQLFDGQRFTTTPLGRILRELGIYIILYYEPCGSFITPAKMIEFYEDTALSSEVYSWHSLFTPFGDDNLAISRIYRDLGCSHCLVQERIDRLPDIPALMIDGFERWMMLMIMAWPEREFERLNKALLKMPISNPDDNTKNPPKNISRTLLPSSGDADWSVIIKRTILKHRHLQTTKNPVCFNCGKLRQECRYMCCLENHLKNSTKMKASRDPQGGYSPGSSDYAEFTDYQLEIAYEDRRSQFPEHFDTANDFLDFLVLRNVSNVQKRFSQTEIEAVVDSIMLVREYCNRIPKRRRSNSHDSFHSATHSHHSGQYSSYHPERESPGVF